MSDYQNIILFADQEITEENSPSGTLPRNTTWEIPLLVTFTRLSGMIMSPNFMNSSVASKRAQRHRSQNMYSSFKKALPDGSSGVYSTVHESTADILPVFMYCK
jgi:hypothetical protein